MLIIPWQIRESFSMWALCALKATCVYRCQCESCVQRSVWNGYTTPLPCVPYW